MSCCVDVSVVVQPEPGPKAYAAIGAARSGASQRRKRIGCSYARQGSGSASSKKRRPRIEPAESSARRTASAPFLHRIDTRRLRRGKSRTRRDTRRKRSAVRQNLVATGFDDALRGAFESAFTRRRGGFVASDAALIAELFRRRGACIEAAALRQRVFFDVATVPGKRLSFPTFGFVFDTREPIGIRAGTAEISSLLNRRVHIRHAVVVFGLGTTFAVALGGADLFRRDAASAGECGHAKPKGRKRHEPSPSSRFGALKHLFLHGPPDEPPDDEPEPEQATTHCT